VDLAVGLVQRSLGVLVVVALNDSQNIKWLHDGLGLEELSEAAYLGAGPLLGDEREHDFRDA